MDKVLGVGIIAAFVAALVDMQTGTLFDTFAISNFTAGTSNAFEWIAMSGRVYNVYWSSNLLDGFSRIESNALNGAFIDTNNPTKPEGFYKITVEIEP
jgi:hypothetical protein